MTEIAVFFIHGLVYAGLLFLISSGLTMVFGMMNVLNLAHASFYMLGAYFSYTILQLTGNFYLSLIICPILLFIIGMLIQRFLLTKAHRYGHVHELLVTFGIAYVITELVKWIWGNYPLGVNLTGALTGSINLFGLPYPVYRLFMLGCAVLVCLVMAFLLYKTRLGIIVRASVDDHGMVNALGINVPLVFMCIFGLGAGLSGFAGAIAGPLLTTYPGMAAEILVDAFVVIVIGGMGSLGGALVASLMIGELQSFGALLFPKLSLALMYLLMAIVLVVKPSGLFGEDL